MPRTNCPSEAESTCPLEGGGAKKGIIEKEEGAEKAEGEKERVRTWRKEREEMKKRGERKIV